MRSKERDQTSSVVRAHSSAGHASSRAPIERGTKPALTPRQLQVALILVGTGLSYKEIAAHLHLREGTVRTHTERIYRAVGVHSRPELTVALRAQTGMHQESAQPAA